MLAPKAIWWLPRLTTSVPIARSADRLEMHAAGRAPGRSQAGPHPLGGSADVPVGRGAVVMEEAPSQVHCPLQSELRAARQGRCRYGSAGPRVATALRR